MAAALHRILKGATDVTNLDSHEALTKEQRQTYMESLRFDQIDARYATFKNAHVKTCRWLLKKSEYQDWLDTDKLPDHYGFLWVKGKPGTGKSTLMKFAVTNALNTMPDCIIISFFFNARGETLEKSTSGMYRSLLLQLLEKLPEVQPVLDRFNRPLLQGTDEFNEWKIKTIKEIFQAAVRRLGKKKI